MQKKRDLNFSLTQINYVLAVQRFGHFGEAAHSLNITQPTLSMQIKKLEEDLGIVIFDRSKKPVLLTDVGKKILNQMKIIQSESRKVEAILNESSEAAFSGELRLGVIPTIAPYVLPLLFPILEKHFPNLKLSIREMQTHKIIESLNVDEIDVGLLATPLKEDRIFEIPLFYEPFWVLFHEGHNLAKAAKVSYKSLTQEGLWLLEEGHCLRNQVVDVCSMKAGTKSFTNFHFESGSIETLKRLVNKFEGYTLVPALAVDMKTSGSFYREFERPIPAREVGLVYQRKDFKHHLIEALGESILDAIPESIRKLRKKDLDVLAI